MGVMARENGRRMNPRLGSLTAAKPTLLSPGELG
jgi:hypothetical protein